MSGIHHVIFVSPATGAGSGSHAHHLVFCSRYDADEFFRALKDVKLGQSNLFTKLERRSSQFWSFDAIDAADHGAVEKMLANALLPGFEGRWIYYRTGVIPVIPTVTGPDWLSGGTYFIRNRRQPNIYWWVHGTHIHASEERRTKFYIEREYEREDHHAVLNRVDQITVQAIPESINAAADDLGTQFVAIRAMKSNALLLSNVPYKWTFGGLTNKDIGVRWSDEMAGERGEPAKPLLVYMNGGGGDEWELC